MVSGYLWGAPSSDYSYAGISKIGDKFYLISDGTNLKFLEHDLVEKHFKYIISANEKYIYIYKSNWYSLSSYGMILSFYITLKIFTTILVVNILTSTTSPVELTYGFNELLSPLKYIKFPVNEVAMILTLSIRFIPSLLDESQRVLKAQASRGVDIKQGKFLDKWKALVSLLIPMFVISFRRSEELSNAMESRAYNPRLERSCYRYFELRVHDWVLLFFVATFFGVSILFSFLHSIGHISFWFAPFGPLELTLAS
ncbi:MAG: energy-coupling factor transporter transmembrane component T family protein [Mycoplasmoidaceae bacterium]